MDAVFGDLRAELDDLAAVLAGLDADDWDRPSACDGWTIADVVLHLAQTNELAGASATGTLIEAASGAGWANAGADVDDMAGAAVAEERSGSGAEVHERWVRSADEMAAALAAADPSQRLLWVAGEMAPRSLASTRIAETWIHAGDVLVGLERPRSASARLWHIARLVHRTLPYAFTRSGEELGGPVRFDLTPPAGDAWSFGDEGAPTVISGPAFDLCLVAGQRAPAADTALVGRGPDAPAVLRLARTFA